MVGSVHSPARIGPEGLHVSVGAHVRLGDASFADINASDWAPAGFWKAQLGAYDISPQGVMRCLKLVRQSQMPLSMGCFVATNAQRVTNAVLEAIENPTITPGTPVHLVTSPAALISSQVNADKTFLDWWLLARSQIVVLFGYNYDNSGTGVLPAKTVSFWSSYAVTATKFRDASSTLGRSIFITATANLSTARMRMKLCRQNRRSA